MQNHIIYLARHGESLGNIKRAFLKAEEDFLTENGQIQVEFLGKFLRHEKFTRIISSDYPRAISTALAVIENNLQNGSLEIKTEPRIRERNCGIFEGKTYSETIKVITASGQDIVDFHPSQGESFEQVGEKVFEFLQELFAELDKSQVPEKLLIVSHATTLYVLMDIFLKKSDHFTISNLNSNNFNATEIVKLLQNTAYNKISIERIPKPIISTCINRNIEILNLHSTDHLKDLEKNDATYTYTRNDNTGKIYEGCIHV